MLAILPWKPEAEGYDAAANPRYHEFVTRMYRAVASLHQSGRLELVAEADGVSMFRLVDPN